MVKPTRTSKKGDYAMKLSGKDLTDKDLAECITKKAHELWEKKGHIQGKDLDIWLEAEKIVKGSKA
jgi:hypothetical protein